MATSMKEYISNVWFLFRHGDYDFSADVLNLPIEALNEKYLPLKNDSRFIEKYVLKNRLLLHEVMDKPDKCVFLLELGYSLIRLDNDNKTPFQYALDKQADIDPAKLLDSMQHILMHIIKSGKKPPLLYSDEADELASLAAKNGRVVLLGLLKDYYCQDRDKIYGKTPFSEIENITFNEQDFYYLMDNGFIYLAACWLWEFCKGKYDFNNLNYKGSSFMHWAAEFNDVRAIKFMCENGRINMRHNTKRLTPLQVAEAKNNTAAIALLKPPVIGNSAVNVRDILGKSPSENRDIFLTTEDDYLQPQNTPYDSAALFAENIRRSKIIEANRKDDQGDTAIDIAIKHQDVSMIHKLITQGVNPFALNKEGVNAFFLALSLGLQNSFNQLVDSLNDERVLTQNAYLIDSGDSRVPEGVTTSKLLDFVANYFKQLKNPKDDAYNHKVLSFLWKYVVLPVFRNSSRADQLKIIYFFKNLHIYSSLKYAAQEIPNRLTVAAVKSPAYSFWNRKVEPLPTATEIKTLLIEVKHLLILHEQHTMLGLNSNRHWGGLGGGFGASTINAKLEEIVAQAQLLFESCRGDSLSLKAEAYIADGHKEPSLAQYKSLLRLVSELKAVAAQRSRDYGVEQQVSAAMTPTV